MPWQELLPMGPRMQLVTEYLRGLIWPHACGRTVALQQRL